MGFADENYSVPKQKPSFQTIYERIAFADPQTVNKVQRYLSSNGIPRASTPTELASRLRLAYKKGGKDAIMDLIELHPDKELFEVYFDEKHKAEHSNDDGGDCGCGCGGKCKDKKESTSIYVNDNGATSGNANAQAQVAAHAHNSNVMIFGVLGLVAITGLYLLKHK